MKTAIHWFRRDLRLTDNTALSAASHAADRVIPVYVLSTWEKEHRWTGAPRQEFLCGCLRELADALKAKDGRLILCEGDAADVLTELLKETGAEALYFNRDPDPYGRAMEERVSKAAKSLGRSVHSFKDVVIHERDELLTSTGGPYRVFTPYSRAWNTAPKDFERRSLQKLNTPPNIPSLDLPTLERWKLTLDAEIIEPGEKAARRRMNAFLDGPVFEYGKLRDIPSAEGTSRLSQDLRFGLISIRELYTACMEATKRRSADQRKQVETYVNELAWREFYMQILFHFPEVLEKEFNEKYRGLRWRTSDKDFDAWCKGETGFPIVDAGMRQLNATGFIHNRLRMIVAMFLTKDLRLYWPRGESYFMQRLVDGDIASNNGGWQWSAGTGADAAPYFRIQNPWSQTKRYDPDGLFIKKWIPELRDVPPEKFQKPPDPGKSLAADYPPPMVDHAEAREATLAMFNEK